MASLWPRVKSRKDATNAAVDIQAFAGASARAGSGCETLGSESLLKRAWRRIARRRRSQPRPQPPPPKQQDNVLLGVLVLLVVAALATCTFISSKWNNSSSCSSSSSSSSSILVSSPFAPPKNWTSPPSLVRVVDGDTIVSAGITVRLLGIDAPERGQMCSRRRQWEKERKGWWSSRSRDEKEKNEERPLSFLSRLLSSTCSLSPSYSRSQYDCGEEATRALRSLVDGKHLRCERKASDMYGRALSRCLVDGRSLLALFVGRSRDKGSDDSIDVGEWMLRRGHAVSYIPTGGIKGASRETKARYLEAESSAKIERLGIWAGEFEVPSVWRERRKVERETEGKEKMKKRREREQEARKKEKKKRREREQERKKKEKRLKKKKTK